ncbi:MAG TPA: hypothetical protein VFD92_08865 [Candidatus Binatia bacterium]|nr:hypothetical protein [Candidatus Binatia bacterium]
MATMRFNHMELTLPRGTLDEKLRADIGRLYRALFGWSAMDVDVVGQRALYLHVDDGQFLLVAESDRPMESPGYDHLGLLFETRAEVDALLARCRELRAEDDRVRIKEYRDETFGTVTVHAFYVKYLLPIWFDVQCLEHAPGAEPPRRWSYVPAPAR